MDPAGKAFTYNDVEQEDADDAPPDAEGDFFQDEIAFNIDDAADDDIGNDGVMLGGPTVAAGATAPRTPAVSQNKLVWSCLIFSIAILTILAIVLTVDVGEVAAEGRSSGSPAARKEQLIEFFISRGLAADEVLRDLTREQGQALAFLAEEEWDGEMSWLYTDLETNENLQNRVLERYVLANIYFKCEGLDWYHSYEFLSAQDHCEWSALFPIDGEMTIEGVTSCNDDGYVQRLYLPINNLHCQYGLPDEMEHLEKLEALVVRGNEIEGDFPFFVRELTNLSVLSFGYNQMEGSLPVWIGEMTKLSVLHLSDNTFTGDLPESLKQLTNLKYLGMDDNFFTGDANDFLPSLVHLEWLYMEDNQFTGTLDWLNNLNSLSYLDVSKNRLGGNLPSDLFGHPNLSILDLHGNQFSGQLPTVTRNPNLQLLSIHSNQLTGIIPSELGNLVNITMLDLSFNSFTGTIPALSETSKLRFLMTSGNDFDGQEMPFFGSLTTLVELSMKGNNIVGNIPQWIGDLTNMKWLDLDANELIGSIPSEIAQMSGLYALLLNRNDLAGTLPTQIALLDDLEVFLIDGNDITGETTAFCDKEDKIDFFISDCDSGVQGVPPQLDCPCCTTCCVKGDTDCSDLAWTSMHDPIVENDFSRVYSFNYTEAPAQFSKLNDANP